MKQIFFIQITQTLLVLLQCKSNRLCSRQVTNSQERVVNFSLHWDHQGLHLPAIYNL